MPEAPHLILRPTREFMLEAAPVGVEGWFTVEVGPKLSEGAPPKQRLHFRNVVVDAGLDAYCDGGTAGGLTDYCAVGTGNTAVANNQTQLTAEVARTSSSGGYGDSSGTAGDNSYRYYRKTRLFTESQANATLAEVGIFKSAGANVTPMWCRQLFKDGGGNATTVTKTSADQLKITYEYRIYPPNTIVTADVTLTGPGTTISTALQATQVNGQYAWGYWNGFGPASIYSQFRDSTALGGVATSLNDITNQKNKAVYSTAAYVAGTFYREHEFRLEPADAAWATSPNGVGCMQFSPFNGAYNSDNWTVDCTFTPKISKANTERLKVVYRTTLARH